MIPIKTNLIPLSTVHIVKDKKIFIRKGTVITPTLLTIHSTGNPTSNALGERNWLVNPNNHSDVSWNICVDDKKALIVIPLNEKSNHSGSSTGNLTSIGLEICESGDREKTLRNAIEVSAYILKKFNLTYKDLRQHFDWNKKNCPRILRDTRRWNWFVEEVKKEMEDFKMFEEGQEYEAIDFLVAKGRITDREQALQKLNLIKNENWIYIKWANDVKKLET